MNYYNQYPVYNGFPNPYDTRGMMQYQNAQRCEIVRVNGKNGADAYQLAPNSSALLLEETVNFYKPWSVKITSPFSPYWTN